MSAPRIGHVQHPIVRPPAVSGGVSRDSPLRFALPLTLLTLVAGCSVAPVIQPDPRPQIVARADVGHARVHRRAPTTSLDSLRHGWIVTHPVPRRSDERCELPTRPRGVRYRPTDRQAEERLCSYSFYLRESTPPRQAVAICPKRSSTNPAVEVFRLSGERSKAQLESERICRRRRKPTPKLAKLKHSVTCSYMPSILAYYHFARILETAIEVPASVVRTMDRRRHLRVARMGEEIGASHSSRSWNTFKTHHTNNRWGQIRYELLTPDRKQLVGALSVNPRGERRYGRLNGRGGAGRVAAPFFNSPIVKGVFARAPVASRFPRTMASAQMIRAMRDVGDLLVLDYLLSQSDRFGNVHARAYDYRWSWALGLIRDRAKPRKPAAPGTVRVWEMMLRDNDCGVVRANRVKRLKVMRELRHLHPRTYARLRWLAQAWETPELTRFATRELRFTPADRRKVGKNLKRLSALLTERCRSGALALDLDFSDHMRGLLTPERLRRRCGAPFDGKPVRNAMMRPSDRGQP